MKPPDGGWELETYEVIRFFELRPTEEIKAAIRATLAFVDFHSDQT